MQDCYHGRQISHHGREGTAIDDIITATAPIQVVYPETDGKPIDPASFTSDGAVHGMWPYLLFDAILQRRARRFPNTAETLCGNTILQFAGRVDASDGGLVPFRQRQVL
jgi:hypothetical protein